MISKRRRFIGWAFLLIAGTATAVLYWPTPRRLAIQRIHALGGQFLVEPDVDHGPRLLSIVALENKQLTEQDLLVLRGLRTFQRLLLDGTPVRDEWLPIIAEMEEIEWLTLTSTKVTDDGIPILRRLTGLESLSLKGTSLTDAGLAEIRGLASLKYLNVAETKVTDQAVSELKRDLPQLRIYLRPTEDD